MDRPVGLFLMSYSTVLLNPTLLDYKSADHCFTGLDDSDGGPPRYGYEYYCTDHQYLLREVLPSTLTYSGGVLRSDWGIVQSAQCVANTLSLLLFVSSTTASSTIVGHVLQGCGVCVRPSRGADIRIN